MPCGVEPLILIGIESFADCPVELGRVARLFEAPVMLSGKPVLQGHDALRLPASDDGVGDIVLDVEKLSFTDGQFVNEADGEALGDVDGIDRTFERAVVEAVLIAGVITRGLHDVSKIDGSGDAVADQFRLGVGREEGEAFVKALLGGQHSGVVNRIAEMGIAHGDAGVIRERQQRLLLGNGRAAERAGHDTGVR